MYKVIKDFIDRDNKRYKVGDAYENADEKRIKALLTNANRCGRPFIEKVEKRKPRDKKEEVGAEVE